MIGSSKSSSNSITYTLNEVKCVDLHYTLLFSAVVSLSSISNPNEEYSFLVSSQYTHPSYFPLGKTGLPVAVSNSISLLSEAPDSESSLLITPILNLISSLSSPETANLV